MSDVLERLRKRRWREVTVNGEKFTIRGLTKAEKRRATALADMELQDAFTAACILLNDDGSFLFTQNEGETDEEYARRVSPQLDDIPPETRFDLAMESVRIAKPQSLEASVKN